MRSPALRPLVISSLVSPRMPIVMVLAIVVPLGWRTSTTAVLPVAVIAELGSSNTLSFSAVVIDTLAVMPGFSVEGAPTIETVTL